MRAGCGAPHVPSSHAGMVPPVILFNRIFWQEIRMERGGEPVLKRFSRSDGETAFFSCSERQGVGLALFPQEECFWNLEADQPVTSEEKPDIQEACKQERPRSGFLKLLKAGFRAQGRHRHGQQECIQGVYGVHKSGRQQVQGIKANDGKEQEGEPGNGNFPFFPFAPEEGSLRARTMLRTTSTGASIITRIILTIMAGSEIACPMALPAPTTCATS